MGGLGNQLFQSSNALSQGIDNNRDVIFYPKSFTPGQGNSTSNYVYNIFRNLKFTEEKYEFKLLKEKDFNYNKIRPLSENTMFYGYFQSSKYWEGNEDLIRSTFQPDSDTVNYFITKYPELNQDNTLSIHVRRSEYLQLPEIHPTISIEYLKKALDIIGNYSTVFVFSDDHEWVKNNLILDSAIYVKEDKDYKELWLMSMCKNHIISNSTFSWWGAYLNKNKNKQVVAPSIWFGPKGPPKNNIYENYWDIVEVEYTNNGILLPL